MRHTACPEGNCDKAYVCLSILQMTLSVTIYFPAHCGHTGSPDWGDVPQGRLVGGVTSTSFPALWPCAVLWPCTFCSDRVEVIRPVNYTQQVILDLQVTT